MARPLPLKRAIIRYSGLFDFDALYATIIDWCKNHGYNWHEVTYKHKVPSPRGAEQEWRWRAEKEVNDYFKYELFFIPHAWDLTEIEITKDGKKKTLTNGRMEIIIEPTLVLDWQGRWKRNRFTEWLGTQYYQVIRREIENVYHDELYYRMWGLQTAIKKFFNMQTKWNEWRKYLGEH